MPNMKTCSGYHWNQNRNEAGNKCSSMQWRYLFICLFDYKALFFCVKDRTCLRMTIPAYCFSIFGSIFGVLFCLLIVNIRIWHYLTKYEKVSMSSLKCEYISSYGQKETFLSWKRHISMVWVFDTFSLDLKIWT